MTATATKPNTTSAETEAWLSSHGAEFELQTIDLADINEARSLRNQARFQALDEHLVGTYAEAMQGGAKFPPIVVAKGPGGFLILDGNHRYAASRVAGKETISAYVVKGASDRQLSILTFDANTRHGMPTTPEERKAHAVYLVDTAGVSQNDAARMLNVPRQELRYELSIARTDRRLALLEVERRTELNRTNRSRLDNVRSDVVFKALAELTILAKISQGDLSDLITKINDAPSESAQMALVDEARERYAARIKLTVGGRSVPRSMLRLNRAIAYAESLDPADVDRTLFGDDERTALLDRLRAAKSRLEAMEAALA